MFLKKCILRCYDKIIYVTRDVYDLFTRKKVEVSIGDLMLNRGTIDIGQFLVASRLLDIEAYCEKGDTSFAHQKTTTNSPDYDEEKFNAAFISVIESYKKNGYNGKSLFLLDKDKVLRNGTHRTAMHLYLRIYTAKASVVNRKWPEFDSGYQRLKQTLPVDFFNSVIEKLSEIEKQLVEDGITFNAVLPADQSIFEVLPSIHKNLHVLNEIQLRQVGNEKKRKLVQFRLDSPQYIVSSGLLLSNKITTALKTDKVDNDNCEISRSCFEGKRIYDSLTPLFIKE